MEYIDNQMVAMLIPGLRRIVSGLDFQNYRMYTKDDGLYLTNGEGMEGLIASRQEIGDSTFKVCFERRVKEIVAKWCADAK